MADLLCNQPGMVDISFHKHKESYGIPPKIRQKNWPVKNSEIHTIHKSKYIV